MKRRELVLTLSTITVLSGCLTDPNANQTESDTENDSEDVSQTDSDSEDEANLSEYEWGEGTPIIEVTVDSKFDGDVVLKSECREDNINIDAGEEIEITREIDGEECGFELYVDGEEELSRGGGSDTRTIVTVTEDGDLEDGYEVI